jgi:hypothetical protein
MYKNGILTLGARTTQKKHKQINKKQGRLKSPLFDAAY